MLGKYFNYWFLIAFLVIALSAVAFAESSNSPFDPCTGAPVDSAAGYKGISKVRPPTPVALKVKPFEALGARLGSAARLNPITWGLDCCLPAPNQGQFVVGPKLLFARIRGEARRDLGVALVGPSVVDFDEGLGFRKTGNLVWSIDALYQFRPRWGIHYSFSPLSVDASSTVRQGFTFGGQTFTAGTPVRARWDRYEHRAGLVFNVHRSVNSLTNFYLDWLHLEDKLTVGGQLASAPVIYNRDSNLALVGVEFNKCLKNFRGNTLALLCKGGIAFLDDSLGYEGEAALQYLIPIRTGRFGFLKGGYRYFHLKKDRDVEMFSTTMDGAFVQVGFLF